MTTPIIILVLLASPLALFFVISKIEGTTLNVSKFALWGLGISFVYFSIGHLVKTDGMVQMLPTWVPLRLPIIYVTGVIEFIVGIALFVPRLQVNAAKLAILLLIVFFPANIYAALNSTGLGGHQWGAMYLLIRTPLQFILIAWAYFLCIRGHDKYS